MLKLLTRFLIVFFALSVPGFCQGTASKACNLCGAPPPQSEYSSYSQNGSSQGVGSYDFTFYQPATMSGVVTDPAQCDQISKNWSDQAAKLEAEHQDCIDKNDAAHTQKLPQYKPDDCEYAVCANLHRLKNRQASLNSVAEQHADACRKAAEDYQEQKRKQEEDRRKQLELAKQRQEAQKQAQEAAQQKQKQQQADARAKAQAAAEAKQKAIEQAQERKREAIEKDQKDLEAAQGVSANNHAALGERNAERDAEAQQLEGGIQDANASADEGLANASAQISAMEDQADNHGGSPLGTASAAAPAGDNLDDFAMPPAAVETAAASAPAEPSVSATEPAVEEAAAVPTPPTPEPVLTPGPVLAVNSSPASSSPAPPDLPMAASTSSFMPPGTYSSLPKPPIPADVLSNKDPEIQHELSLIQASDKRVAGAGSQKSYDDQLAESQKNAIIAGSAATVMTGFSGFEVAKDVVGATDAGAPVAAAYDGAHALGAIAVSYAKDGHPENFDKLDAVSNGGTALAADTAGKTASGTGKEIWNQIKNDNGGGPLNPGDAISSAIDAKSNYDQAKSKLAEADEARANGNTEAADQFEREAQALTVKSVGSGSKAVGTFLANGAVAEAGNIVNAGASVAKDASAMSDYISTAKDNFQDASTNLPAQYDKLKAQDLAWRDLEARKRQEAYDRMMKRLAELQAAQAGSTPPSTDSGTGNSLP